MAKSVTTAFTVYETGLTIVTATACGSVNGDYMLAYCFANETTAQRLEDLWMQAWLKWVPALIDSGLHIRPAPPCAPDDYGCICGTPGIDSFSTLRINETTAPTSSATVGFMSDFSKKWANQMNVQITAPDMTLLRKPLVDALDEQWRQYWRAYNTQVIAHELDHVMGLHHEHQRPGAYDIFNSVNPSLIFRPQYLAGYSNAAVTLYTLTENEAPWVKGLDLGARFMAILSNRFLAQKHWPEVVDWVPYSDADLTHLDIVNGGLIDYDSIIIYGTAVGTEFDDHGKSSAVLSQAHGGGGYPDEDEPGGWVYSPVYICGTLDPAAYELADIVARLRQVTRHVMAGAAYLDKQFRKRYISIMTDDEYTAAIRLQGERVRKEQLWPECAPHSGKHVLRYCFEDEYTIPQMRVEFIGAWAFWQPVLADNNTSSSIRIAPARECGATTDCLCSIPGINKKRVLKLMYSENATLISNCTLGFNTNSSSPHDPWPNRLFFVRRFLKQLAEPIETDDDQDFHDWFAADNNLTVAHELGHCSGLLHEHQRPGVYDAWGARDPSIIFRPQYIRSYNVTFKKIKNMTDELGFAGLVGPERIWALLRNLSLVDKHWPEAGAWAPIGNGEMEHLFYASGGPVDLKSVMIYSSTTGVSVDGKGEARGSIIRDLKIWEDDLDWPQGRRYNQIHPCGNPNPRKCTGPSDGDIARRLALYPARSPTTPRDLLEGRALQQVAVGPAYKPMVVIRGDVTRTVRPVAPQTPSKGDYNAYPPGFLAQKSADLDYDTQVSCRMDHMGIAARS
ncbi:hypothetical protein B0A48_12563 [Cryoendolithus antarcticus]|uniref:Peptidase M12A domain-containing protein n=1 Tax=Cryoendolithus antarcticus TaxID=1507870 RepID=A0A1V8SR77_9PEZI|nr:hypothetical protein B0A48_12563 [Cryoendolithus antarcticus]